MTTCQHGQVLSFITQVYSPEKYFQPTYQMHPLDTAAAWQKRWTKIIMKVLADKRSSFKIDNAWVVQPTASDQDYIESMIVDDASSCNKTSCMIKWEYHGNNISNWSRYGHNKTHLQRNLWAGLNLLLVKLAKFVFVIFFDVLIWWAECGWLCCNKSCWSLIIIESCCITGTQHYRH